MKDGVRSIYNAWWSSTKHPYQILDEASQRLYGLIPSCLEHGCGYTAPLLQRFRDRVCGTCGVDLVDFDLEIPGIRLIKANIETLPIEDNSVDIVFPAL